MPDLSMTRLRYLRGRFARKANDVFRRVWPWGWGFRNRIRNRRAKARRDRPARKFLRFMNRRHGPGEWVLGMARQWKIGTLREWFVVYFPERNRVKFMSKKPDRPKGREGDGRAWTVQVYDLISREANENAVNFATKLDP